MATLLELIEAVKSSTGASPYSWTIFTERLLHHCGSPVLPLLTEAGLDEGVLSDPQCEAPVSNFIALCELIGQRIDPNFGLMAGLALDSTMLGAFGHAVRSAASVEQALHCMCRYMVVHMQATRLHADIGEKNLVIDYQVTDPTIVQRRQDAELTFSLIHHDLGDISGGPLRLLRVDFEHPAPADISLHKRIFDCPLYFGQSSNRLHYPRSILERPLRTADPRLYGVLEAALEEQRKSRTLNLDFIGWLSRSIASSLGNGEISLEQIAGDRGMSGRTLQRRLRELGLEFSDLVENVRRAVALEYIANSHHSLTEVALLVGYSEASSFSRAFRRWTNLTPRQYRQQAREVGEPLSRSA